MLIGTPDFLPNLPSANFVRTVWHSEADKAKYGRTVLDYGNAWLEAEQMSVLEGIRPLCLQPINTTEYLAFLPWAHDNGLHVRIKRFAAQFNGFSHYYQEGNDLAVVAMSKNKDMVESDNCEQYLGYPNCCQNFFAANFPKYLDPVLQWANNEDHVVASSECVPVLRSIGIRRVSHIPCSPTCYQSQNIGIDMASLLPTQLSEQATEILASSMSWDCYRGIAIVKTPWFRIIYRSVPYKDKVLVTING